MGRVVEVRLRFKTSNVSARLKNRTSLLAKKENNAEKRTAPSLGSICLLQER